ncbi:MAG: ATP-binding cassette domain-containing protein [Pseudonocardiaceae bacterium]|nr:ATP-binding cassette domain-containing protein [Pseudonocardiaceae bacterium]
MGGIVLNGLEKAFGSTTAIHQLDLTIVDGGLITLLGPSGCGKTTTLRCVAGLETPTAGSIQIGDTTVVDVAAKKVVPPHKRKVGMVFQSYALWPHMTTASNVAYPLKRRRMPREQIKQQVTDALKAVGMEAYGDRYAHELSGGQQQRAALARGLVSAGDVMLFDEPLSNLDARLRMSMRSEIRRLHDKFRHTAIYVTHDQHEALAISDQIVIMNGGRIEQIGLPREVYDRPANRFVADFVGFENLFDCLAVESTESGPVAICAGGLRVPVQEATEGLEPGCAVAFRARLVKRARPGEPRAGVSVRGRVVEAMYAGEALRFLVEIAEGEHVTVDVPVARYSDSTTTNVGENIDLFVPLPDIVVVR